MVSVCGGNCLFGDGVKNCNENFCRFLCSKYECSKQVFYSQSQPWIKFYSVFAYIYKTKKKKRNRYLQNPTCQCSFSPSLLGRMMMISREDVKRAWQCSIGYTIFLYMSVFRYQDYCSFGLLTIWTSSHLVLWTSGLWTSGHPDIWPLDFWSLDQCMTDTVSVTLLAYISVSADVSFLTIGKMSYWYQYWPIQISVSVANR